MYIRKKRLYDKESPLLPCQRGRKPMPVFCQRSFLRVLISLGLLTFILVFARTALALGAVSPSFSIEPTNAGSSNAASTGYFIYASTPGAIINDSLHVTNTSRYRDTVSLAAVDVTTGQMGGTAVLSITDPKRDVGSWITLSQQDVTLNAGQSINVPFSVTIPEHVRPGQHGGAIIAENTRHGQRTPTNHGKSAMKLDLQSVVALGVLINLPGPLVEHLSATGVHYDEKSLHQRLLLTLTNTGTQLIHPEGSLQIRDDEGKLLQTVPMTLHTFIPQTSIDYPIDIQHKALVLGSNYGIQLHLKYEHNHDLDYKTTVQVPLPEAGPLVDQIQSLVAPPSGNFFSQLTLWHYAIGLSLLFLILSALFFWSQKLRTIVARRGVDILRPTRRWWHKGEKSTPVTGDAEDVRIPVHARSKGKNLED